ncbi:hypothetical protein D0A34_10935 [Microcoleus vaginatus PCC 9802]|nr:hypothetical protein D0A34_10935 [Microcoleus vaginatus PCC 9802]
MAETIFLTQQFKHPLMKYFIAVQVYGFLPLNPQVARFRNFAFYFCKFLPYKIGILRFLAP